MPYPNEKDLRVKLNENDIQKIMEWYLSAMEDGINSRTSRPFSAEEIQKQKEYTQLVNEKDETQLLAVLGNHEFIDYRDVDATVGYDVYRKYINEDVDTDIVINGYHFIGVSYDDDGAGVLAAGAAQVDKVAYVAKQFQMNHVPAQEIPAIGPKMEHIPLVAEPRRIAVRYDQITAFQAKTDYGFSLDKQIAEQACGELAYEIDTEIVDMLYRAAFAREERVVFNKRQPIGVSKFEHYNAFLEVVEEAKAIIYKRTRKFHPNYMVIASDVLPVLRFVNGFTAVKNAKMNGPYKVGELDGLDVYVSPAIDENKFFFGLNGSDMMSSAGVYAPYMAIVPTQLLGTPDGALQQGFSTWYAKALLNDLLLVGGKITNDRQNLEE